MLAMHRRSAWLLCVVALMAGLAGGWCLDWTFAQRGHAAGTATESTEAAYRDLRADGLALSGASEHLAKIAKVTTPSVVHIQSERTGKRGKVEETGSGVLLEAGNPLRPHVVTNRHVVDGSTLDQIDVHLFDGRVIHPKRVWTDKATDLAVLLVDGDNLQCGRWGDSQKLEIGHLVLAMGSPFGLSQSITLGIISAKGRRSLDLGSGSEVYNQDFLQTDAAINPGNSGGPLMNLRGEVIGINTAIASNSGGNEGIGFSIPSHLARRVVEQLVENGKVTRAYVGVKLDPAFDAKAASKLSLDRVRGARVTEVYANTPAAKANLKIDDVILQIDGQEVQDETHLINIISLTPINRAVKLTVWRDGKRITVNVVVADRTELEQRAEVPFEPGQGVRVESIGLTLHRVEPAVARQLGYARETPGVLVLNIDPRGIAARDVQLYDLIEEVARVPVSSVEELRDIVNSAGGETLLLKVRRVTQGQSQSQLIMLER